MTVERRILKEELISNLACQSVDQAILENFPDMAWFKDKAGHYIRINNAFAKALGVAKNHILGKTDYEIWPFEHAKRITHDDREIMHSGKCKITQEEIIDERGNAAYQETMKTPVYDKDGTVIGTVGITRDITSRKRYEEALDKEKRHGDVQTRKLRALNDELEKQIAEYRARESDRAYSQTHADVTDRVNQLERENALLRENVEQLEREKNKIRESISVNIERMLMPSLKKLRRNLKDEDIQYLETIERNMHNILSDFGFHMSDIKLKLTPREIEICNLVRNGTENKEIAEILNLSVRTVETHRKSIRRKLGLMNKDINLAVYLRTV